MADSETTLENTDLETKQFRLKRKVSLQRQGNSSKAKRNFKTKEGHCFENGPKMQHYTTGLGLGSQVAYVRSETCACLVLLFVDRFYITLFSALEQTNCARM